MNNSPTATVKRTIISTCPVCEKYVPEDKRLVVDGGAIHCPDCWLEKDTLREEIFQQLEQLFALSES